MNLSQNMVNYGGDLRQKSNGMVNRAEVCAQCRMGTKNLNEPLPVEWASVKNMFKTVIFKYCIQIVSVLNVCISIRSGIH